MKHASNGEVLLFKRPIEQKFSVLLNVSDLFAGLNEDEVVDFEFISNAQAIQTSVKTTFGYMRSRNSSGTNSVGSSGQPPRQPPISRPTSSNSSSGASSNGGGILSSMMNNGSLSNGLAQGIAATLAANGHQQSTSAVGNGLKEFLMEQHHLVIYV
jgi:hypothetical protein